jgi:hypothetical protein
MILNSILKKIGKWLKYYDLFVLNYKFAKILSHDFETRFIKRNY